MVETYMFLLVVKRLKRIFLDTGAEGSTRDQFRRTALSSDQSNPTREVPDAAMNVACDHTNAILMDINSA